MNPNTIADQASQLAAQANALAMQAQHWAATAVPVAAVGGTPFISLLAVFVLACFVGYYVVWNVTPALHSPLMGVTNAISSVIIVGAMLATGLAGKGWVSDGAMVLPGAAGHRAMWFGFTAVLLASINICGGFVVTGRMLAMFKSRQSPRKH
jgi:H+-translocating NAD(P) transhydrogenase subunit alpha